MNLSLGCAARRRGVRDCLTRRAAAASLSTWGAGTRSFQVVDAHCEGEPARVLVGGMPTVPGKTMYDKRNYVMEHMDDIRTLLITEPRGYPCQNLDIILPPTTDEAVFGFVIAEQNKIYPAMSGHNTICVATVLLETGMIPMVEPVTEFTLEAPAGPIQISAACCNGKATEITLKNQPAFVAPGGLDVVIDVPTFGAPAVSPPGLTRAQPDRHGRWPVNLTGLIRQAPSTSTSPTAACGTPSSTLPQWA